MSTATEASRVSRWQRSLLPAVLLGDQDPRTTGQTTTRSLRDWVVDITLFAIAVVVGVTALAGTWSEHTTATGLLDIGAGAIACLALWWRRSHPVAVALLAVSLSAVVEMAAGAAFVALFTVAVHCRPQRTAAIGALSVVAALVSPAVYSQGSAYDVGGLVFGLAFTAIAIGAGLGVRARREVIFSLQERARRLESEQRLRVEQARRAERARIAREMHDSLAHRVSLLSVHAGALEFRPDAPPAEIAEAARVIRENAHAALQELREVMGLLREDDEDDAHERPQPTLAQVPRLVEESRAAGMQVRQHIELDEPDANSDALGRTTYRIVQEGLTNARKHAPGSVVEVTIGLDTGGGLAVEVINRPAVGTPTAGPTATLPGGGRGLIGLAERVALTGGRLEHGPISGGGYALRATLPRPA
jgi:signal transduction histidine kinase